MNLETSRTKISGFFGLCNYFIKKISQISKISYKETINLLILTFL